MTETTVATPASTERATKSPAQYLGEPMTANQAAFCDFVELAARQAGVWPSTQKEQDAFRLGVKGAGLYARYQKAKGNGGAELKRVQADLKKLQTAGTRALRAPKAS